MGAALKTDILAVDVAEFYSVKGCPLARALRDRFKRMGHFPARKFKCVYSPKSQPNCHELPPSLTANGAKRVNGTLVTATAVFGLLLAQLTLSRLIA